MPGQSLSYDAIIIGAGAAGLMCAATAGARGRRVLLIDHAEAPGKKILISGGGRCNFTNRFASAENYLSRNPHFCKSALSRFSAADFLAMVEARGIRWHERKHGQLFCNDSARDILDMLLADCSRAAVELRMKTGVHSVAGTDDGFELSTGCETLRCRKLVVASGGLSLPKTGASPLGWRLAEQFALGIVPPRAGLVPFTFTGTDMQQMKSLAGISLDVVVCCGSASFAEAMLFTHRGLSGPAILQISSYWQPGDDISVDLLPGRDVADELAEWQRTRPQAQLSTALAGMLPKRLVRLLCDGIIPDCRLQGMTAAACESVAAALHDWRLKPSGTEGYRTAEVTLGGVDTDELSSTDMQARRVPGLYFIGEVVDVTGHLGGFNFQWAWSSGHACGMAL
jgi:predicted Rossmann fold flavoprotein